MNFSPETELKRLANRIDILKKSGDFPPALLELVDEVYRRQLLARAEAKVDVPSKDKLPSADQHAQGAPLIDRDFFPHDREQAKTLFREFLDMLCARDDALNEAGQIIDKAVTAGDIVPEEAFDAYLKGDETYFEQYSKLTPEAPRALPFLVQSSLAPSISAAASLLAEHHDPDTVWLHGHCPVCASLPLIGELREKAGFRYVSCSFCATRYRVPRLACAFCGEKDAQKLAYFSADDEKGYRVEVCESCKMYIKSTDFRELDKTSLPLIDDLESLSLDILAGNEGYIRPTLSGLGF